MAESTRPPASFWLIGILLLLWELAGCFACVQQVRLGAAAMGPVDEWSTAYYAALPGWYNWVYAVATFGGLAGGIALLARKRIARTLFWISLVAVVVMFGYAFAATDLIAHKGLEQVLASARERAGLTHESCHELRHTCLTRLRAAGMALEAVQAQAGHASIESTRIYLHLADDWLASQYRRAAEVIDAQIYNGPSGAPPNPAGTLERVAIPGFRRMR